MKINVLNTAREDYINIRAMLLNYGTIPANKFRTTYLKFQSHVRKMPEMFPEYEYNPAFRAAVLVYEYIAFYKIDETAKTVNIYHIMHGSRNIAEVLKNT